MTGTPLTVRGIALEHPSSIRVFEQFGIDYCCGGCRGRATSHGMPQPPRRVAASGGRTSRHEILLFRLAICRSVMSHGLMSAKSCRRVATLNEWPWEVMSRRTRTRDKPKSWSSWRCARARTVVDPHFEVGSQ
ncbi:DUF542 domain-containing protein [Edaphobacter sp.]|uniref:DUF542 domain-containing protein n=1 Tax=Edaphobacter sp. TaxID=1934404 RepID=UPI0039C8B398